VVYITTADTAVMDTAFMGNKKHYHDEMTIHASKAE
jgi:hypothetical protein